jgi:hypothetical protein
MTLASRLQISSELEPHSLPRAVDMADSETLLYHHQNGVHQASHFLANQVKNVS